MTGGTHKRFAISSGYITGIVLYLCGITSINYYITLPVLLLVSKYGGLFPDVDHTWKNVKEKNVSNRIINWFIHITGGKHRSWQTHSWDICLFSFLVAYFIPIMLLDNGIIDLVNKEVMTLVLFGFSGGWASHLLSDMLTSSGVRLICFINKKIAIVPRNPALGFNTGTKWEKSVSKVMKILNFILGIIALFVPIIMGVID